MNRRRALGLTAATLCALPLLSGCVAAAIPVLAAGGVLGTQLKDDDHAAAQRGQPRVAIDVSPSADAADQAAAPAYARNYTLADGTRMEVLAGPASPADAADPVPATLAQPTAPAVAAPSGRVPTSYTAEDGTRVRVIGGELPMPSGTRTASPGFAGYDTFYDFAKRAGTLPIAGSERRSALLASPGTLAPETRECSVHPAAVLIDLDPGTGVFDPATATHADPELAGTLAGLRAEGVAIAWASANTADRAGAVRRALVASGLDPAGRDELALLRYPEERKQTRREDFAKAFCVVAIAGDARTDFDELFQYVRNPTLAAPLDALIGNGWFLIPQPLT